MKSKLFSLLLAASLAGCAAKQLPLENPVKVDEDESLIISTKFNLKKKKGRCLVNLYQGRKSGKEQDITSFLKVEYCKAGDLGTHTEIRWTNENSDDYFEQMCWHTKLLYKDELFLDYETVCYEKNVSIEKLLA